MKLGQEIRFEIGFFGGLSIAVGDKVITDNSKSSKQIWSLFEYLVIYRSKNISQEQLIQALWPDESSNNPSSALKNLVYRLRTALEDLEVPFGKELIVTKNGLYSFNNDVHCIVDTEKFEEAYQKAFSFAGDSDEQLRECLGAIELYKGNFLPSSCYEEWVIPLSLHYRSMYFKCVYKAAEMLLARKNFSVLESLCKRAIAIDAFEEQAHKYLCLAYLGLDRNTEALSQYNYVADLLYREMGVSPSVELKELYKEMMKADDCGETDISVIRRELYEDEETQGAFYCDYEVFKSLYKMEARLAERTGQAVFVALITIAPNAGESFEKGELLNCMDSLIEAIHMSLRRGDAVSRISTCQYILMLPNLNFENGQMVMNRIKKKYERTSKHSGTALKTSLHPMELKGA